MNDELKQFIKARALVEIQPFIVRMKDTLVQQSQALE